MSERLHPVDSKEFLLKEPNRIFEEAAGLYRDGWSLKDIAQEYGCSKSKIRADLKSAGVEMREKLTQSTPSRKTHVGKQGALPYFGFCYFEGRIIQDPREFPVLKVIHCKWKEQRTIHQITIDLNQSKTPSRKGKKWSWAAVRNIVKRFEHGIITLNRGGKYEFKWPHS